MRRWLQSSAAICSTALHPTRRSRPCCTRSSRTNSSTTRMPMRFSLCATGLTAWRSAGIYGSRAAIVPYVMPGFALALKAKEVFDAHPQCEGLILHKHGIFTFGSTAREAYDRMISLVSRAERMLRGTRGRRVFTIKLPKALATAADIAPVLRGLVTAPGLRFVLAHRANDEVLTYVNGRELTRYSRQGPVTPDHVICTKPRPLILPAPDAGGLDTFAAAAR